MSGTVVQVQHGACGDVELNPRDVHLYDGPVPVYTFECPTCHDPVRRYADPDARRLLATAGIRSEHVPDEIWEPHHGDLICWDDLLDAHQLLEQTGMDVLAAVEGERAGGAG